MGVYAPYMFGKTSVLRVYNTGHHTATVRAVFSYRGGITFTQETLLPRAVGEIRPPAGVLTGTRLSAVLTGTQPIAVVVNDFGLEGEQATSYAAMPASAGRRRLALPDILSQNANWNSRVVVQNVGQQATPVTVVYTRTHGDVAGRWQDGVASLMPGATHVFTASDKLPEAVEGIAMLYAQEPVVAIVHNSAGQPSYIYSALLVPEIAGTPSLYFPMLAYEFQDWNNSEVQFMNARPVTASFDLEVDGESYTQTVSPWGAQSDRQNDDGREIGWVGSARIEGASALYSLVWMRGDLIKDPFAAYSAVSLGAKRIYLPFADQGDNFTVQVAVQNLTGTSAHITVTYHLTNGAEIPASGAASLGSYGMALYTPLASELAGGALVEADQIGRAHV